MYNVSTSIAHVHVGDIHLIHCLPWEKNFSAQLHEPSQFDLVHVPGGCTDLQIMHTLEATCTHRFANWFCFSLFSRFHTNSIHALKILHVYWIFCFKQLQQIAFTCIYCCLAEDRYTRKWQTIQLPSVHKKCLIILDLTFLQSSAEDFWAILPWITKILTNIQ